MEARNFKIRFYEWLFKKKIPVLVVFGALSIFLLYSTTGVVLKEDIMDLLPTHDPVVNQYKTVITNFKSFDYTIINVGPTLGPEAGESVVSKDELINSADIFAEKLYSSGLFKDIQYKWDVDELTKMLEVLRGHRASLFTEADEAELVKRLTPEAIYSVLEGWKRLLTESPAPYLGESFRKDPLAIDTILLKKLEGFNSLDGVLKIEGGRVFSSDMKNIMILAKPIRLGTDNKSATEVTDFMDRAVKEVASLNSNVHIAYMGSHRFSVDNSRMIKGDIKRTLLIAMIAIVLLIIFSFYHPFVMTLLSLLPVFFGGIFATSVLMFFYPDISVVSFGCGAMLMGISVDFGIHFLYHVDQLSGSDIKKRSIIDVLNKLLSPLLMTAITTVIAFLTLTLSVMPGYRQLGLFAGLGIIGSFVFSLFVLPLIIGSPKTARKRPVLEFTRVYTLFFIWAMANRALLLIAVLLFSGFAVMGVYKLEFDGDVQKLNAVYPETKKDWDIVIDSFGGALESTSVIVAGKTLNEALLKNEKLEEELGLLQAEGVITGSKTISTLLPSIEVQNSNMDRWRKFWSERRTSRLLKNVDSASSKLGMRFSLLKDTLTSLPEVGSTLKLKNFSSVILKMAATNHISVNPDGVMIMTNIMSATNGDDSFLFSRIEEILPGAIVTNGKYFVEHIIELIHSEMRRLGAIIFVFVAIAMAIYARNVKTFFRLMLPLFLSLLWMFGVMGWLGIRVNIMNSVVIIFVFGIVDDYCVFLHEAWGYAMGGSNAHLSNTSGAITISAITTVFGMGAFIFASHPALRSIGTTALLGILFGFMSVFITVPLREVRTSKVDYEGF